MKNLFFTLLLSCVVFPAAAQFSLGLSAGANVSFAQWRIALLDQDYNPDFALGWRAAVLGEWKFSPSWGLRVETGAQLKAVNFNENVDEYGTLLNFTSRNCYQYWELGILLKASPFSQHRNFYLLGGITAGRLSKGWTVYRGPGFPGGGSDRQSIALDPNQYNLNTIATDLGIGWNIPLNVSSEFLVEGRFQYSLNDLSTSNLIQSRLSPLIVQVGYQRRL